MRSEGRGYSTDASATTPYAAAGTRLSWEHRLRDRLTARARLDVNATLIRARLHATGTPAGDWTAPPASAAVGVSLIGRF